MPRNTQKSPFTSSFQSAVKRGTPASTAVANIAKRTGKTPSTIITSLAKADVIDRQKFNGQSIIWPIDGKKSNATISKGAQVDIFQGLVDWAIASGQTTPEKISANSGSQQAFVTFVRRFFAKQISSTSTQRSTSTTRRRTSTSRSSSRTTTGRSRRTSTPQGFQFQSTRSTSRRLRRAA